MGGSIRPENSINSDSICPDLKTFKLGRIERGRIENHLFFMEANCASLSQFALKRKKSGLIEIYYFLAIRANCARLAQFAVIKNIF